MRAGGGEARAEFQLALQFLTRLPVPDPGYSDTRMARSPRWYPLAGALIGLIVAVVYALAARVFPVPVAVLVSTGFGLMLTGALHEDGFADCCDGLGGGATRERAMEIMRDSRLGSYGALGLGMMLALKALALIALAPEGAVYWGLVAAHAASRASAVVVMATSTYQRPSGAGTPVSGGIDRAGLGFALACGAAAVLPLWVFAVPLMAVVCALAGLALGHLAMRRVYERRLGGHTGDCLGAVQQCSELGFYLGLLAWL